MSQNKKKPTISVRDLVNNKNLVVSSKIISKVKAQEPGELRWIDPATLRLNHEYQRDLNTKHVEEIAAKFHHRNMKPATGFVDGNGDIMITDGQHTVTAAFMVGLTEVPVYVHILPLGITEEEALAIQSRQFTETNMSPRKMDRYDMYRNFLIQARADKSAAEAALAADPASKPLEEPLAYFLRLEAACARAKAYPSPSNKKSKNMAGAITHQANLETAWTQIGEQATEDGLIYLRKYFPHESIEGAVQLGLTRFIKTTQAGALRGRTDVQWDPAVLFKAMSKDGTLSMGEVFLYLKEESASLGLAAQMPTQNWIMACLRSVYNRYIQDNRLQVAILGGL